MLVDKCFSYQRLQAGSQGNISGVAANSEAPFLSNDKKDQESCSVNRREVQEEIKSLLSSVKFSHSFSFHCLHFPGELAIVDVHSLVLWPCQAVGNTIPKRYGESGMRQRQIIFCSLEKTDTECPADDMLACRHLFFPSDCWWSLKPYCPSRTQHHLQWCRIRKQK